MSNADFENLKRHVLRPEMISGIHNYCDRWCERCSFTNRCSVFTAIAHNEDFFRYLVTDTTDDGAADHQTENERFADLTATSLEASTDYLREAAEEAGIDLDEVIDNEVAQAMRLKEEMDEHPLVLASREYTFAIHKWLNEINGTMSAHVAVPDAMKDSASIKEIAEHAMKTIGDALETIIHYHMLIATKIFRAAGNACDYSDEEGASTTDADGSAKVALIAIDRSFTAFYQLIDYLPEQERTLLDFLARLEHLRRGAELAWPNARAFVRPGFDDSAN